MSRDKRLNRTQEVVGSILISSTKVNNFRNNNLARPVEPANSRRRVRVSSFASSSLRDPVSIHSHSALHFVERPTMDLTNRISRSLFADIDPRGAGELGKSSERDSDSCVGRAPSGHDLLETL